MATGAKETFCAARSTNMYMFLRDDMPIMFSFIFLAHARPIEQELMFDVDRNVNPGIVWGCKSLTMSHIMAFFQASVGMFTDFFVGYSRDEIFYWDFDNQVVSKLQVESLIQKVFHFL